MSKYTYFKIFSYQDGHLTNISNYEVDNCIDALEEAIKRCNHWHRKKLYNKQLVIVRYSRYENKIVNTISPPYVFALLSSDKKLVRAWTKNKALIHPNFVSVQIEKFEDIKRKKFDYYEVLSDWNDSPENERILSEVQCRCRSLERQLSAQHDYHKLLDQ